MASKSIKGTPADDLVAAGFDPSYSDYKLSASKDFGGYVVGLAYSNTNAKSGGNSTLTKPGVNKRLGQERRSIVCDSLVLINIRG